jgi:hypothetical protein
MRGWLGSCILCMDRSGIVLEHQNEDVMKWVIVHIDKDGNILLNMAFYSVLMQLIV